MAISLIEDMGPATPNQKYTVTTSKPGRQLAKSTPENIRVEVINDE